MALIKKLKNLVSRKRDPQGVVLPYAAGEFENVTPDTAMKVSAMHRGVIFLSTQVAKLPVEIKDKKNKEYENEIFQILNFKANKEMNAFQFKLYMMITAIIHGNSYAEIERDLTGKPIALWPLYSPEISLERTPEGQLVYRVANAARDLSGNDAYLPLEDMFHIRGFHTRDGFLGQGVVAFAREALGISLGADRFAKNIYTNGGMPSGVLTVEGTLDDDSFKRLKEDWKAAHGGRKTGGVAILEEGTEYKPISYTPEVLQFLESRKFGVIEIARFLGLPPTKLFDGQAMTYNNIEHANLEVATDTLDAYCRSWEIEIKDKLLPKNLKAEFDLFQVFRADTNTRATFYRTMLQLGAITPNEIRIDEGYAPYEGGDRFYMATNNFTPFDRMDEVIDSQIGDKDNKETDEDNEEEISEDEKELNNSLIHYFKSRTK